MRLRRPGWASITAALALEGELVGAYLPEEFLLEDDAYHAFNEGRPEEMRRYRRPPQGEIAHALRFAEAAYAKPIPPAPDPEGLRPPRQRLGDVYQCPNCSQRFTSLAGYRGHRDRDHGGRYEVPRLRAPLPVHRPDCGAGPDCGETSCTCWCHKKASAA